MSLNAAIIIIGNEILAGHTVEANIPFLAKSLNALGIGIGEVRIVADIASAIIDAVNGLRHKYRYVFTTGGIGPTHDDITSESVAVAFGVPCVEHPLAFQQLHSYYAERGMEFNTARRRMASVPQGAELIENPISSGPGFQMGNVFVMAGVPNIMQAMFAGIVPRLVGGAPILTRKVICNVLEGQIAAALTKIQTDFADLDIGSYPSFKIGEYELKLVVRGTDARKLDQAATAIIKMAQSHGANAKLVDG